METSILSNSKDKNSDLFSCFKNEGFYWSALLGILALCIIRPLWDTDLFWHVAAGDLIRTSDSLPSTDTFSAFYPEAAWTPFQWAYEVILSLIDQLGGLSALRWFHIGLHLFAFGLFAFLAQKSLKLWGVLATALMMVAYLDRFRARPHVFNLIGILLLLIWLAREKTDTKPSEPTSSFKRAADHDGPLMLLGLLWANIHGGGSMLLFAIAGPFALGCLLRKDARALPIIRALIFTSVLMLMSPGFLDGVFQAGTMVGAAKELIPEWQSTLVYLSEPSHLIHPFMGAIPFVMLLMLVVRKHTKEELPKLLSSLSLIGLSLMTARFLYLAAFVPLIFPEMFKQRLSLRSVRFLTLFLGLLFLHEHLWVQRETPMDHLRQMDQTLEEQRFPVAAMHFLSETKIDGRAMHQSDWGGLILYFSRDGDCSLPRIRVAADGRGNLKPEVVEHLKKSHQNKGRAQYLEKSIEAFPIDLVMFPPAVFRLNYYDRSFFRLVYADTEAEIYLVKGPRFEHNLKAAMDYYRLQDPKFFKANLSPEDSENAIRAWVGQQDTETQNLKDASAALLSELAHGNIATLAKAMDTAEILSEHGQLNQAFDLLNRTQDAAPKEHPIGSAIGIRSVINRLRTGSKIEDLIPMMNGLRTEGLAPADHQRIGIIREVISPSNGQRSLDNVHPHAP